MDSIKTLPRAAQIYLSVSALLVAVYIERQFGADKIFWDLAVYQGAAEAVARGEDPYANPVNGLRFVYAPAFADLLSVFSTQIILIFLSAYAICVAGFVVAAPPLLAWSLIGVFGLFAFQPQHLGISVATGNVTIFVHLIVILLWVKQHHRALLVTIVLASLVKPSFAAYFGLWFCAGAPMLGRAMVYAALGLLSVIAAWWAQAVLDPVRFDAFLGSLSAQVWSGSGLPDNGFGTLFWGNLVGLSQTSSLLAHVALWAVVAISFRAIVKKTAPDQRFKVAVLAGAAIICCYGNMRLKTYDLAAMGILVAWLGLELCRRTHSGRWVWAFAGLMLLISVVATDILDAGPVLRRSRWAIEALTLILLPFLFVKASVRTAGASRVVSRT
ncbi:MAG: hypothetical protein AAF092_00695 [Pseudomonadota bacterium]